VRLAVAIVVNAAAFVIWDVGTRPPLRLVADIRAGLRDPRRRIAGIVSFVAGALLLLVGGRLVASLTGRSADFDILELLMLISALAIEQLIGPDLRAVATRTRTGR
jgi:UPF0716 family protein affecting phage T7 exclusion